MKALRVRLIGTGYLVMWRVTRWLPERLVVRMFTWAFDRSWRNNDKQRAVVTDNLRPIIGDGPALAPAVRAAFHSYGRYWAEAFRLQDLTEDELAARMDFEGADVLDRMIATGGAVYGVPHLGNWDAAGRYVANRWRLAAVVEVLRPKALFDRFVAYRRALGMTIIPLHRGEDVTSRCVEHIKATGDILALVCDRDLSKRGIPVKMFGRMTTMPAGPAVVAIRAGVPLCPGATYQAPDGRWRVRALPPIATGQEPETPEEIAKIMQRLADSFEEILREAPEQWHAFVPYWTDAP